jgi:hypothetical protein
VIVSALLLGMLLAAAQAGALPTFVLPPAEKAWVVRVVTSGGFTGRGSGSYTASSAGEVACLAASACPTHLAPDTQRALSRLVDAVPVSATAGALPSGPAGTCNDCVTTTVSVRRRDRDGERVQTFTWDETTRASVPADVLRLGAAVTALAVSRSQ